MFGIAMLQMGLEKAVRNIESCKMRLLDPSFFLTKKMAVYFCEEEYVGMGL